jgi:hypothetical protein
MDHMIVSPSGESLPVELDQLVDAAQRRWPGMVRQAPDPDDGAPLTLEVQPEGEPFFQVIALGPVRQVATDGTWEQALEVAALTTSLIPPEAFDSEWWFTSEDLTGHTVLRAGMTSDAIAQGWTQD